MPSESAASPSLPWSEDERVAALLSYGILDTPVEADFDDIARLAAATLKAPIAVVNLIASDRQWFKAEVGIGARELPLDVSICAHALLQNDFMVVPDTRLDGRFACNPLVTAEDGLRFYAGALLRSPEGLPIGTVCVLDNSPRPEGISDHERLTLDVLARQVMTQLELRKALALRDGRAGLLESAMQQRISAEAALRQGNERFRAAVSAIDGYLWTNDAEGQMRGEQPGWAALTGQTEGDYQDYGWADAVHPDDAQPTVEAWREAVETRRMFAFEHRVRTAEGAWRLFAIRAVPMLDEHGAVTEWVGIHTDVTDRRADEEALRESETLLRFLDDLARATAGASSADDVMAIATRMVAQHLDLSNCAYADMDEDEDGFTIRGDWAATGSPSIVGHYRLADFGTLAVERLSQGQPLIINDNLKEIAPHEAATFQSIGIAATICMPLVKDGRLTALMAIHDRIPHRWSDYELALIREVTERCWAHVERVRAEAELRASATALSDLNATLEDRVEERTSRLLAAEDALRQSQKMEAVGQLTGGIAHDFNNLLTVIVGNIDIVSRRLDDGADPRVRRSLDNALKGANRAASLTQRLLAFSRQQPLAPRTIDVARLLAGMSDLLTRSINEAIAIRIDAPSDLWPVEADPHQLENAILNLAVNARDAMPTGGTLTVEARRAAVDGLSAAAGPVPPGDYVVITVRDTGVGMSRQTIDRAFDPFFTTKEVGKGTGLGLSMVYGFVKQTGGFVLIDSVIDEGTTVALYLRAEKNAVPERDAESVAPVVAREITEALIVVEDDEDVRAFTVETLRELGYSVIEAHDGAAALRLIETRGDSIDLLMTDVIMPEMSGPELVAAALALQPRLRVVYTSGYTRDALMREGRLQLGVDLLAKPFTFEALSARIREALDR